MSHLLRTAALAVGTCVLLVLPLAAPAGAAVVYVHDQPGDGSNGTGGGGPRPYGDIGTVRVAHGDGRMWLTVDPARGGQLADRYEFWVDVNIANPGPEFLVDFTLEVSPEVRVSQTDRFGQSGRSLCRLRTGGYRPGTQVLRLNVPRGCLRTPGFAEPVRLRVSTHASMEYERADWAPGVRLFGPWVKNG